MIMLLVAWYATGQAGTWWTWYQWLLDFHKPPFCPTPMAIGVSLFTSCCGPYLLVIALVMTLIRWLQDHAHIAKWWTTPICKRSRE